MPISGGKYVAPMWVDNAPPALDATELQAISDSVASYADPFEHALNLVRPNLLDNWYFVGGGSQQGGGQFPINSKGQTSYSTLSTYTIDRWYNRAGSKTITTESSGLKVVCTNTISGGAYLFDQTVKNSKSCRGLPFSVSVIVGAVQGTWQFGVRDIGNSTTYKGKTINASGLFTVSGTVQSTTTELRVSLLSGTSGMSTGDYIVVEAVKLELGDTQTLAHQENGSWVLNEVPNFDEQFMRCAMLPGVPFRYETGSYKGTGTYGSGNANSLSFEFVPKAVVVRHATSVNHGYFINTVSGMTSASYSQTVSWSGTTVGWYSPSSASQQMNESGATYNYIAIG